MNFLTSLTTNANAWRLLAVSALILQCLALFFQYELDLKPCIMCVYQRVAIWSIFAAGLIGSFKSQLFILRLIGYGLWGVGAIWGAFIAFEHVAIQSPDASLFYICEYIPNFPDWAPLHDWLPALFAVTGSCLDVDWQFLGFSMSQWMFTIFLTYSAIFSTIVLTELRKFYQLVASKRCQQIRAKIN